MDCLLAFLTILFISFFYTAKLEMRTSSAHLASCATVILALTLFGCLGILSVGVVVVYVSAVALFLMAVISSRRLERSFRTLIGTFFTPATLLFIVCSVTIYVICVIRQPAFRHWDEFSFWGIAAKVIWSCRELYTTAGTSMITSAYLPGLPLFGAFFQYFFNPLFTEYKVYIAYDVLMIASLVAVIGDTKWKDYLRWIVGFVFCISVPGLFSSCYGWMNPMFSAYSDTVLGLVFGGALLAWFMHEEKDAGVWISVFLDVALLTCMKDIGMAFGLGIGMLITADLILRKKKAQDGIKRSRLRTAINCLLVYVIPVVVYIAWLKYFTSVTGIVSSEIPYEYSMVDILIRGKDPRFFNFLRMEVAALSQQLVNFGSIRLMSLVFLAYPICAVFFISDRNRILRVAVLSVLLLMGFVVYNIFFAYLYTAVFHTEEIVNYQRYMSSYVIGWFMAVSGVAWFDSECRSSVGKILKTVLTVALMILISVCAVFFKGPMETDVSSTGTRAQYDSWFLKYASDMDTDDRFFIVAQNSNGGEWMIFNYAFLPAYTVPTYETGNLIAPGSEHTTFYDVEADSEDIIRYLREQDVDYVFVIKSDDYFVSEFGHLFDDELAYYYDGSGNLYKVIDDGTSMRFSPIVTPDQIAALHNS